MSLTITGSVALADLLTVLLGTGIDLAGTPTLVGDPTAFGTFTAAAGPLGHGDTIGFPTTMNSGILLSTGQAITSNGPNNSDDAGTDFGRPGDAQLAAVIATTLANTFDAAILTVPFRSHSPLVQLPYLFASEEYNEFVYSAFEDGMAIWLNGVNLATLPDGTPITINKIHNGNPVGVGTPSNPTYFTDNDIHPANSPVYAQLDGFVGLNPAGSAPMLVQATVVPGQVYTLRIGICDVNDGIYDSAVFLGALQSVGIPDPAFLKSAGCPASSF